MINIYSKYDNMHKNEIFYALICINNHVNSCINCMLSMTSQKTFLNVVQVLLWQHAVAFKGVTWCMSGAHMARSHC